MLELKLPSRFQIDEDVMCNGKKTQVDGVSFIQNKVFYILKVGITVASDHVYPAPAKRRNLLEVIK